jgi:hypothetical protein
MAKVTRQSKTQKHRSSPSSVYAFRSTVKQQGTTTSSQSASSLEERERIRTFIGEKSHVYSASLTTGQLFTERFSQRTTQRSHSSSHVNVSRNQRTTGNFRYPKWFWLFISLLTIAAVMTIITIVLVVIGLIFENSHVDYLVMFFSLLIILMTIGVGGLILYQRKRQQ